MANIPSFCFQNPSVPNYMMNQMGQHMGPGPPGGMRFGGPGGPGGGPQMANAPRMGPRGQGFQSIPPSGPMMRQQAAPPNMMGNGPGPGDMQRMRLPNHMMGPGVGVPNGPQKVPVSHPSPQHGPAAGSPAGMWANMGSGSPNPNGMPIQQQQSIGSPRTPGMISFFIIFRRHLKTAFASLGMKVVGRLNINV